MEKEEIQLLFKKYHEGTCTEEEKASLEAWYLEFNEHDLDISPKRVKAIGERIFRELSGNHTTFIKIGVKLAVAASVIDIMITVGLKFFHPSVLENKVAKNQDAYIVELFDRASYY